MSLTIEQLKTPPTRGEITQWLINRAQSLGFDTTGWQPGRAQWTILNLVASVGEPFAQMATTLVTWGFNSTVTGGALDLYSASRFNNTRDKAKAARGYFNFVNSGILAHQIINGQVFIRDTISNQFVVDEDVTVPAETTTQVKVRAVLPGAAGQIPNSRALTLVTPLAGVSVNATTSDGDSWASIQAGSDPQTDLQLQTENSTKWGLLAVESTDTKVVNVAVNQPGISKATVISNNPRGGGTVDVLVANDFALATDEDKAAAQAEFARVTFLTDANYPPAADSRFAIKDPIEQPLQLVGAIYYEPSKSAEEIQSSVQASLRALLTRVPIGGVNYTSGITEVLTKADIIDAIKRTRGVISLTLNSPEGDFPISPTSMATEPADGWFSDIEGEALYLTPGER